MQPPSSCNGPEEHHLVPGEACLRSAPAHQPDTQQAHCHCGCAALQRHVSTHSTWRCVLLLLQGKLAVLDVGPSSPLHALLHEGTEPLRTVYEEDFGTAVADLLLLQQPHRRRRSLSAAQQLEAQRWHRFQSQQALAACSADTSGVFVSY